MSVQEIAIAISQLAPQEVAELMTWLSDYHVSLWDRQIEGDLEAGRLDNMLADVDREYRAGMARPL